MTALEQTLGKASAEIRRILEPAIEGRNEVSNDDALKLFQTSGADLQALLETADEVRRRRVGDLVTFVVVRNINFTNICYVGCRFCGFARRADHFEAEFHSNEEVALRAEEGAARGATEVCIQGGLHPNIDGYHYRDICVAIKERVPSMHIHAFSPFEIKYGAGKLGMGYRDFLAMLKEHGLDTIPGTAAEIFDPEIRAKLTKNKLKTEEWTEIIKTAHEVGIRTTSTMMYGHVDAPEHWVAHMDRLRTIQKETGGFTEFVPLGFVHYEAPLFHAGESRPGPTRDENVKVHAVARLMFQGLIDNIQVSWVKMGPRMGQYILMRGANDFGGTLMNETISRSAGSPYGEETTPREFCSLIREIGRTPAQRNTRYDILEVFDDHDPPEYAPFAEREAVGSCQP